MNLDLNGTTIQCNEQGFLCDLDDWNEDVTSELAKRDGVDLFVDHWELIWYFRDYYKENLSSPSMHMVVRTLGHKDKKFHDQKEYEKHIYKLFPRDPVHEVCKLAGLPMPPPDT